MCPAQYNPQFSHKVKPVCTVSTKALFANTDAVERYRNSITTVVRCLISIKVEQLSNDCVEVGQREGGGRGGGRGGENLRYIAVNVSRTGQIRVCLNMHSQTCVLMLGQQW